MEPVHRKILQSNRAILVKELEPSKLCDGLLSRGVFTQDMIDEIQGKGTRRDQARQLVIDLEMRGRQAFPAFLQCLAEMGQEHLVQLLHGGGLTQPPVTPALQDKVYDKGNSALPILPHPTFEKLKRPLRPRRDSIQSYKMDATPCGLCLIINNMEFEPSSNLSNRKGSNIDCDRLEKRFRSFSFIVSVKSNLKAKQIRQELSALSKKDHSQYDCCVVVILSHGTEVPHCRFPGAVHGVDGPSVAMEHITSYLNGQRCPSLQGKPKLFFIQACGGDLKDTGFEVSTEETEPSWGGSDDQTDAIPTSSSSDSLCTPDEVDARTSLPTPSDILVSYSTYPGYVSWRDSTIGSWYVDTLDRILEENAVEADLVTMLTMVNNEVSQNSAKGVYKQMPGSLNFLRMHLYFQPSPQV